MDVRFVCPKCTPSLEAPVERAGQEMACPRRSKALRVPLSPAAPTLAVSTPVVQAAVAPKTSGMAIASMVLGIVGLVLSWLCGGFPLSLLAIILGHVAFGKISRQPQQFAGRGMAIAGFTTGMSASPWR
jgi:hypothetical protein